jgi:signal peptide peptidase SppA
MTLQHLNPLAALLAATGESVLAIDAAQAMLRAGRVAAVPDAALHANGGNDGPRMVAVIPVQGNLTARGYGVPMDRLRNSIRGAANNPDVSAIVLDMDSPGGTVAGTPETAQVIREAAKQKKVIAVANTLAASAAYWLASQATELVITPSADVGSIGVFSMHLDVSKAMSDFGIAVTMIHAGKYKVEGNPFEALGDEAMAYTQARVDESYDAFIKDIALGRGISQAKVRDDFGQGRTMGAASAVANGMADRIATMSDVLAGLTPRRSQSRRSAMAFR